MARLVEPRTLKGFRDYPPALMIPRERLMEAARNVFRSYGFAPIDTPALEYTEVLLAKLEEGAEVHKQLFRFTDQGGRDVALRFDLTVPLARFVSQHANELGLPFKRYHLAPVWRGESPQVGRYREFAQCDFDTIGSTSNAADVEIALVIHDLLVALGFERFSVRVNNRRVLNGLLHELGLADDMATPVLRALDKLPKVGRDAVTNEMTAAGLTTAQADGVIALAETTGTNAEIVASLEARFAGNETALAGVAGLRELVDVAAAAGVPEGRICIDLSICRGLDYYTGTVYETFLDDLPTIGSICSGGRYDDLTGRYTKQSLPGVGASLGLDRLLAAMEQLGMLAAVTTTAPVLVTQFDAAGLGAYHDVARRLRAAGIGAEVYPDAKKLGAQLGYAERKGFAVALIAGDTERTSGTWKVKNLANRDEQTVADADVVAAVAALVSE
jgi:histidyl-tRNA synthetase